MCLHPQSLVQLGPMSLSQSLGLQLANKDVGFKECLDGILDIFKCGILAHAAWHVSSRRKNSVKLLAKFAGL